MAELCGGEAGCTDRGAAHRAPGSPPPPPPLEGTGKGNDTTPHPSSSSPSFQGRIEKSERERGKSLTAVVVGGKKRIWAGGKGSEPLRT